MLKYEVVCLLLTSCGVIGQYYEKQVPSYLARGKRSAVGALHIVTNHAQPIHADVKSENSMDINEKPCAKGTIPSHIEPGVVFQVTAPEDTIYEQKSLRKSLPSEHSSSGLDLVRSISRIVTLTVVIVSAVLEFYPMLQHLIETVYNFMSLK